MAAGFEVRCLDVVVGYLSGLSGGNSLLVSLSLGVVHAEGLKVRVVGGGLVGCGLEPLWLSMLGSVDPELSRRTSLSLVLSLRGCSRWGFVCQVCQWGLGCR